MSMAGILFVLATAALFLWGCWLGYRGMRADHVAWLSFGHAPGAPGTYDPHHARGHEIHAA